LSVSDQTGVGHFTIDHRMTVFNEDKEKDREQIDIDELNSLLGLSNEPYMGKLKTQDARHAYI
jgi:hypothetical protein